MFAEGESNSKKNVWLWKAELGEAQFLIFTALQPLCSGLLDEWEPLLMLISMYLQDSLEAAWELIQHLEEIICL